MEAIASATSNPVAVLADLAEERKLFCMANNSYYNPEPLFCSCCF